MVRKLQSAWRIQRLRLACRATALALLPVALPAYFALPAALLVFFTPAGFGWSFGGYFALILAEEFALASSVTPYVLVPAYAALFFILLGFRKLALVRDERLYSALEVAALLGLGLALSERAGQAGVIVSALVLWWLSREHFARMRGDAASSRTAALAVALLSAEWFWFVSISLAHPLARAALLAAFTMIVWNLGDSFFARKLERERVFVACAALSLAALALLALPLF